MCFPEQLTLTVGGHEQLSDDPELSSAHYFMQTRLPGGGICAALVELCLLTCTVNTGGGKLQ